MTNYLSYSRFEVYAQAAELIDREAELLAEAQMLNPRKAAGFHIICSSESHNYSTGIEPHSQST